MEYRVAVGSRGTGASSHEVYVHRFANTTKGDTVFRSVILCIFKSLGGSYSPHWRNWWRNNTLGGTTRRVSCSITTSPYSVTISPTGSVYGCEVWTMSQGIGISSRFVECTKYMG